ncbi:MAG TPA: radical SAM protein, partial [Candidatus Kapabacteria bacterium]|nr:radical SAM protein [Candidatus Kapabacteria bacterium]
MGVESGSQKVLEAMNKRIPLEDIATTIINLGNAGIKVTTYFIMGFPGETEEDFQQTLDFIETLKDNIYEAECNPFGFYPEAQVSSAEWQKNATIHPLYPETARDMLLLQSWIVDVAPHREE